MKRKFLSIFLLAVVICTLTSCSIKKHEAENYSVKVGGELDLSYVSRDFRKYWRAIAEPVSTLYEE